MEQDKKQIYIGPTIQHIQNSQFLIKNGNHILLLNKRQLHLLDLDSQSITVSKIDSERVSSCTVHQELNIYLVKTQSDIFIVNQTGQSLGKLSLNQQIALMQSRFIFLLSMQNGQCQDPHERIDKLIYITDQNLHISDIKITFERAILKQKKITQFTFQLKKKQTKNNQIDPTIVFDAPEWIEKCKIFKELGYFVCYNKHQTMVFKLPKYVQDTIQHYLTYRKTSKAENMITDVAISYRQKQIIFSYESGVIKVYRFNQSKKYLQELKGHQKQCHSLYVSDKNNQDILYSCGFDNSVRIWNLYQFEELYSLRIDIISDNIILLSDELAFIKFNNFRKSCLCKINAYKMEPVMVQNKGGKITSLKCDGEWGIVLYSNNYAQMFLIGQQHQNKQHVDPFQETEGKKLKNYNEKIQFPLKYGNVISAKKLKKNQYAIILQKGFSMITLSKDQIISQNFELKKLVYNQQIQHMYSDSDPQEQQIDQIYKVHQQKEKSKHNPPIRQPIQIKKDSRLVELIHEKLLGTYLFSILQDWKGIPTAINVTFVTFIVGKTIPFWDMDQKKKIITKSKPDTQRKRKKSIIPFQQQKKQEQLVHIVLGTEKGIIYIVDIQNRIQFQSRIIMHSGPVQFIHEFLPKKINNFSSNYNSEQIFFISYDQSKQMCFWSLSQEHPPNIYCRVTNRRDISHLSIHKSFLLCGQKQGKISIFEIIYQEERNQQKSSSPERLSPILKRKLSRNSSRGSLQGNLAKISLLQSKNQSLYGHMKKVTTGDYINYKQKHLFITGSEDFTIKLWLGLEKILLFELKIFDPINHLRFLHNGLDFMMAHHDQISLIKRKNIEEIMRIDNQLDKKYANIPYFGHKNLSIKYFFMKEDQQFHLSMKDFNPRLKNKKITLFESNSTQNQQKYNSRGQKDNLHTVIDKQENSKKTYQLSDIPQQIIKPQNTQQSHQMNFITKLNDEQKINHQFMSPEKKLINIEIKQKKQRMYAKSEERLKAKKSFHIASTFQSKEYNEAYFLLPKINVKNSGNNVKKILPSTSFRTSSFLQQIKSQRQRAFSNLRRYQK